MSHHIIELKNVSYTYPDGNNALKDISFMAHHGESVGIIGANGAGKSTILMLLMGLFFSEKGEISIGNVVITKKTLNNIRQKIGMVFQNPDNQLFMPSIYEDVAFGPRNYKLEEKEVSKRVDESLEAVGIKHLKDRAPYRLSGGEKRAAAIAAVLSMQPDILLLDEPTAALDPKSRRNLINILNGFDHIKIITSHDLDMIYEVCNRVLVAKDGKIIADGKPDDILTNKELLDKSNLELPLSMQKCKRCNK